MLSKQPLTTKGEREDNDGRNEGDDWDGIDEGRDRDEEEGRIEAGDRFDAAGSREGGDRIVDDEGVIAEAGCASEGRDGRGGCDGVADEGSGREGGNECDNEGLR